MSVAAVAAAAAAVVALVLDFLDRFRLGLDASGFAFFLDSSDRDVTRTNDQSKNHARENAKALRLSCNAWTVVSSHVPTNSHSAKFVDEMLCMYAASKRTTLHHSTKLALPIASNISVNSFVTRGWE